ncbi:MAG: sugar ABC transporter permease [Trueperaceae bacterium]
MTYLFFLPAFLLVAAVSFLPLFYAVRQSFFSAEYLQLGNFVGFQNYTRLLFDSGGLGNLRVSLVFVAGTVAVTVPIGFGLALLLNRPLRFRGAYRTILILPWVVSQLVTALLWMWLLNNRFGPIAYSASQIGLSFPNPITSVDFAMPSVILANAWRSYPLVMLFVLAALQTIPTELTDAAKIDGATKWQNFWHVTMPLIRNTTLVALVLTTLHAFNMVTMILLMTGGGPAGSTDVLALRVFKEGFLFYRMGIASAAAVVIFLLNIAFTLVYIRVLRSDNR